MREVLGSRLATGSSASMNLGCCASARAMPTRCCSPPDRASARLSALCSRATCSRQCTRDLRRRPRGRAAGSTGCGERSAMRPTSTFFSTRQPLHQVVLLEDHGDVAPEQAQVAGAGAERRALDDDLAAGRLGQPVDAAQQRRLAGARRAQHDDELAGPDRQRDVLQRLVGAVGLREAADLDHRYFCFLRSMLASLAVSRTTS